MLTCTSCGADNPAGQRFCGHCGSPLVAACPACGTPAPAGARFCGECGTALTGQVSPLHAPSDRVSGPDHDHTGREADTMAGRVSPLHARSGRVSGPDHDHTGREAVTAAVAATAAETAAATTERRVCSVLFADLVGFTPLSESRDPEEVRALLSRYFDTARTVIVRYGGVVEKFIGDAVMAVWGTPVAAEGDAERAVRAGLDLVAAVAALGGELGAEGLALRAGIVTGEVAATIGALNQGMVAGDAVNTAARVQAAARPGSVWVDDATHRHAGVAIGFADAGAHHLKGKAADVQLWQATRVLSSVGGAQRVDGLEAPMTGRAAEERTLRELFHACADRRIPRLVTVTGAAGVGKTRLGWEFEKYVDGLAEVVWWHRGRCLTYGDGIAFWALAEAMRQRFEIAEEDPVEAATAKFCDGLAALVSDEEQRTFVGVRLGRLLGLTHPDDDGAALARDELFAGWRQFLELLAVSGPVLLLIEDAQHADEGLLDFLVHVIEWTRQAPIFVVAFGRTPLIERRPDLVAGRNRSSLSLDPLDERSLRELVAALVRDVPERAVTTIIGQAQGNPLFAVETVRSLIDRDVIAPIEGEYRLIADIGTLTVPDSLHGLLAARLDALDPALRRLVGDAAVVGSTFPAEALAAVSGRPAAEVVAGLGELVRREILDITADPLSPQRGAYAFSQNLVRQVAYDTLSRQDRRARHLAVAQHLQSAFAEGGEEVMDVVARHYLDAIDAAPGPDDAAVRRRAFDCLTRAAERSSRSGAQTQAARSFGHAADLVVTDDAAAAARLLEQAQEAWSMAARYDDALAAGARARELFESLGDDRGVARAAAMAGQDLVRVRRLDEARTTLTAALETLRQHPDGDTLAALARLIIATTFSGDIDAARALADEALGLAQSIEADDRRIAEVFGAVGLLNNFAQRTLEAAWQLRCSAELAERAGDRHQQILSLTNLANTYLLSDPAAGAETARRAAALARGAGDRYSLEVALATVAEALVLTGDWSGARATLADAGADQGPGASSEDLDLMVGVLAALQGDVDVAAERAALPVTRGSVDVQDVTYLRWFDAELARARGHPDRALDLARSLFAEADLLDLAAVPTVFAWSLAVRCAFELGRSDDVHDLIDRLGVLPIGHMPAVLRSERAMARARLAAAEDTGDHGTGDHGTGDDGTGSADVVDAALAHALVRVRAAGSPFHLALGLLAYAEFRLGAGHDVRALLDEAAEIGARLGAAEILHRVAAVPLPTPGAW